MAETKSPSDEELVEGILQWPEGHRVEFKRAGRNDRKLETIVAFANSDGGFLVLGVEDAKKATGRQRLFGLEENPESVDELKRLLTHRVTPPLRPPETAEPFFLNIACVLRDGSRGTLAVVKVDKSAAVHSIVDGGTPARFSASNRWLSAEETTRLSLQRGKFSAVDELVPVSLDLLDTTTWRSYAEARRLTRPLPEALRHINMARPNASGELQPTRGAVRLFAEEPNGLLNSKCTVRVFHYRGDRVEHSAATNLARPPRTAGGPLIEQIRKATELTIDALASGIQVGALGFEIVQAYPVRVLREAITNAVVHRERRGPTDPTDGQSGQGVQAP